MDRALLQSLLTPQGQSLLAEAMTLAPDDRTFLTCTSRLAKRGPAPLVRAALQTALWRSRAAVKFSRAAHMYFIREALEQATSEPVARHRARRFVGKTRVADLGCGIGGDALALATASEVLAIDRDPLRLDLAALNLTAYEVRDRVTLREADALTLDPLSLDAVFVDPDRRIAGRRQLSIAACEPPLEDIVRLFPSVPIVAKLAPGVPLDELARFDGELECVSLDGELKECTLWLGDWCTAPRRATVLPSGATLTDDAPLPALRPLGPWLIDPGPAVTRAGLLGGLAARLGAWPLDPSVVYLSAENFPSNPFARAWRVWDWMPLHAARLRDYLRSRAIGHLNISRRGVAIAPEELLRKLKLQGHLAATLVLTPIQGQPCAVVCDPLPVQG